MKVSFIVTYWEIGLAKKTYFKKKFKSYKKANKFFKKRSKIQNGVTLDSIKTKLLKAS